MASANPFAKGGFREKQATAGDKKPPPGGAAVVGKTAKGNPFAAKKAPPFGKK
jgi:hypothetical protein